MHRRDDYLFREEDLDASLRGLADSAQQKVDGISRDQVLATPVDDLVEHLSNHLLVSPLQVYEDSMEMEQEETKVDVGSDSRRYPLSHRGPIHVAGIRITVSLPYSGDPTLWKLTHYRWQ